MKAFRIGYIVTFSFLLILMMVSMTVGFFPAPTGPKRPEYPKYDSSASRLQLQQNSFDNGSLNTNQDSYSAQMDEYENQLKIYEEEQKTFMQAKVIPYARNVFVVWLVLIIIFEAVGLLLSQAGDDLVGGGFALSGVWAVVFGPIGCLLWFVNSLVASMGTRVEQEYTLEPIWQALGITSLLGVVALLLLGLILSGAFRRNSFNPQSVAPPIQ